MKIDAQKNVKNLPDTIGVVIIGRNEGKRIESCIKSVLAAGATVTVYVDSQSTDGSVKCAVGYGIPVIELGNDKPLSAARARNAGAKILIKNNPQVDYIHFIDGDCELDVQWLEKAEKTLIKYKDVAVVCGRLREKYRSQNLYTKLCDMAWYLPAGEISSCGGIATIRTSTFLENDGYNEMLIAGEEPEFFYRLRQAGHKIFSLEDTMGTHDVAMTRYSEWWTRSVRTGFAYANAKEWGWKKAERRSLVIWGGVYPLLIVLSYFIDPLFTLVMAALFPVQIYRIYLKIKIPYSKKDKLLYSVFCMLDKVPEFIGFLKYRYAKLTGRDQKIIEYKN